MDESLRNAFLEVEYDSVQGVNSAYGEVSSNNDPAMDNILRAGLAFQFLIGGAASLAVNGWNTEQIYDMTLTEMFAQLRTTLENNGVVVR